MREDGTIVSFNVGLPLPSLSDALRKTTISSGNGSVWEEGYTLPSLESRRRKIQDITITHVSPGPRVAPQKPPVTLRVALSVSEF